MGSTILSILPDDRFNMQLFWKHQKKVCKRLVSLKAKDLV